jgi:carboxypeptidase family protein
MDSLRPRSLFSRIISHTLSVVLIGFLVGAGAAITLSVSAPQAFAQGQASRTVQGKVVDKSGAAIKGAIVYLKDSHTLAVKSAVTVDDGSYHFGQLAQNTDYELWAQSDGKKSGSKNISSFDNRSEFDFTLKIDK